MSNHDVRHLLRPGDYIKTEFRCTADHGAHCRVSCDRCRSEEQCVCSENDREPDLQDQGECLLILWLQEDPEETFNGEQTEIRGPGWQPITPEWNGDTWDWDYAPEALKDTGRPAQAPAPTMPEPPTGAEWVVITEPGRTMPTQVTVKLRTKSWPRKVLGEESIQCGSFFNQPGDEHYFKSVVTGLANEILSPTRDNTLPSRWISSLT